MNKTVKLVWNIISWLLVAVVVALAVLLVGMKALGFQVYAVLSGSMEPTYHVGSLIYVKSVDTDDIQVGDAITFMLDENTLATHRVTQVIEDSSSVSFKTKGDANNNEDAEAVSAQNVLGVPKFSIPYLGYVANYIQNPPGTYIAIAGVCVLLILVFIPDIFAKKKEE
jgi:signal peptidase I